jgi:carbonic anhydrase/acetyltransferase-like protein (isoleucine patch superfamily)
LAFYEFEGKKPVIGENTYVHPEATIIGDVIIGEGCYIGPGARIRGDWGKITIGPGSNIQDNCVIHVLPGETAVLGPRSHIGHGAILHGPILGEHVLVGMGAIIMDYVTIGDDSCVGAGAMVTANTNIPPRKLILGSPAKAVADIDEKMYRNLAEATAWYLALPPRYLSTAKQLSPEECIIAKK